MTIRMRAKDGSIQTFPEGTSGPAVRMAMLAHDNRDSWGGMAAQVAKSIGQQTEADSDAPARSASHSGLAQAIGAIATPDEFEALKTHPQFGPMLEGVETPSDRGGGQFQLASYAGRTPKQKSRLDQAGVWVGDRLDDVGEGALDIAGPGIVKIIESVTGRKPNDAPLYPPRERPPNDFAKVVGALSELRLPGGALLGLAGYDPFWNVADAVGNAAISAGQGVGRTVDAVGKAGRDAVKGIVPDDPYQRPEPMPRPQKPRSHR